MKRQLTQRMWGFYPAFLRGAVISLFFLTAFLSGGRAQSLSDHPIQVFGGYSYLNFDRGGYYYPRANFNGWAASINVRVHSWLAAEGDVDGSYRNNAWGTGYNAHDYQFLGGPRINIRHLFVHALAGADALSLGASGASAEQTAFAAAFGGGVQVPVRNQLSVQFGADYVLTHHDSVQNDFRATVGFAYAFGGR